MRPQLGAAYQPSEAANSKFILCSPLQLKICRQGKEMVDLQINAIIYTPGSLVVNVRVVDLTKESKNLNIKSFSCESESYRFAKGNRQLVDQV